MGRKNKRKKQQAAAAAAAAAKPAASTSAPEYQHVAGDVRGGGIRERADKWLDVLTGAGAQPGRRRVIHLALIAFLAIAAYSNTLGSPFVWDEDLLITNNRFVHDLDYFVHPEKAKQVPQYGAYAGRYITYLTFAINYHFGKDKVMGYHIVNIGLHALNAILVCQLVLMLMGTPFLARSSLGEYRHGMALFAGAVFASHPLMTEAVTYVFQRHALLVSTFYLLSVICYGEARSRDSRALYIAAIVSALLATKSKETAFTLPAIIALMEFMFLEAPLRKRLVSIAPFVLAAMIIPITVAATANVDPMGTSEISTGLTSPPTYETSAIEGIDTIEGVDTIKDTRVNATRGLMSMTRDYLRMTDERIEYLLTQMRVMVRYIRLFFLPTGQNLDYDFPTYTSLLRLPVLLSIALHMTLLSLGVLLWRRATPQAAWGRLAAFGIFWFYIALSVESSIIVLEMIITEYRAYMPSAGLILAVTAGAFESTRRIRDRRADIETKARNAAALIIAVLAIAAFARNSHWRTEAGIWEDAARKSPAKTRPLLHVGYAYEKTGHLDMAIAAYNKSAELDPDDHMAHYDIGVIYNKRQQYDLAEKEFLRAKELNPEYPSTLNNLATLYIRKGRIAEAETLLIKASEINRWDPNPFYNLSIIYLNHGRYADALEPLKWLEQTMPPSADIPTKLGIAYRETGEIEKSLNILSKALSAYPNNLNLLINMGITLERSGKTSEAEAHYKKAIPLAPKGRTDPYEHLARLYLNAGRNAEAMEILNEGLTQNPDNNNLMALKGATPLFNVSP